MKRNLLLSATAFCILATIAAAGSFGLYFYVSVKPYSDHGNWISHHNPGEFPEYDNLPMFTVKIGIKEMCDWCSYKVDLRINELLFKSWGYSAGDTPVNDSKSFIVYPGNDLSGIPHNWIGYKIEATLYYYAPGAGWTQKDSSVCVFTHGEPLPQMNLQLTADIGID